MPRKARIDYPGLTHHVMARTFDDRTLFSDDEDRRTFVSLLSRRIAETEHRCYAWALMDSHFHLLVRTSDRPLWQLMKPLNTDYARYYNRKYGRRGPLFGERFKSIATQDQRYLEELVRYIHLNPIRSGVCRTLAQLARYPWTGHSCLMGTIERDFQDTRSVLRRFGTSNGIARKRYEEFLQKGLDADTGGPVVDVVRRSNRGIKDQYDAGCWVIGDTEFQQMVLQRDREKRLTIARYRREGLTLRRLARFVARAIRVPEKLVVRRSKRTPWAAARKVFCHLACEAGFSTREVGSFLSIQQAAVSHAARQGAPIALERKVTLPRVAAQ